MTFSFSDLGNEHAANIINALAAMRDCASCAFCIMKVEKQDVSLCITKEG